MIYLSHPYDQLNPIKSISGALLHIAVAPGGSRLIPPVPSAPAGRVLTICGRSRCGAEAGTRVVAGQRRELRIENCEAGILWNPREVELLVSNTVTHQILWNLGNLITSSFLQFQAALCYVFSNLHHDLIPSLLQHHLSSLSSQ